MKFEYYNLEAVRLPQLLDLARPHCPRLKDAYTGPSEMLELYKQCMHSQQCEASQWIDEKSNKIKEGKTHSKPATKSLENLCN